VLLCLCSWQGTNLYLLICPEEVLLLKTELFSHVHIVTERCFAVALFWL